MDYSKLSDAEINRKVAAIIFPGDQNITPYSHRPDVQVFHKNDCNTMKDYCNNPADAWPIIVANKIALIWYETEKKWSASGYYKMEDGCWEWDYLPDEYFSDENPLRAAIIVFLMMRESE
ncbi:DUF2591 domain-containing protein [Erwinia sorbitola]|uniref:DUF2591 domain-containing protein n=2 Tax=Erwinia sorbitola TaxID=2681984 RepID=A0A6I6ETU7_9GAMM|nr:DUF2591 domain-containing protein [Erwinia sorbitola]